MLAPLLLAATLAADPATPKPGPAPAGAAAAPADARVELPAPAAEALKEQLGRMNDAGLHGQGEALVDLTYPRVIAEMGGRARALEQIAEAQKAMKAQGASPAGATVGAIRGCARSRDQLQCVVDGAQQFDVPGGQQHVETEYVAFSSDGGKHWTFLAAGQDPKVVRANVPEVSALLPLHEVTPPKFVPKQGAAPPPAKAP